MPRTSLTNPLQSLLATAAKRTPAITGESAKFRRRHEAAGHAHVVLCDVSSSMAESAGHRRRIDHLREALAQVVQPGHTLIAFASSTTRLATAAELPEPSGGTALELALLDAAACSPAATLVISDGEPTQPEAALAAAERLPGVINVLYCGPETNSAAIDFMRRLARAGCGQMHTHAWGGAAHATLARSVRRLLPAPR